MRHVHQIHTVIPPAGAIENNLIVKDRGFNVAHKTKPPEPFYGLRGSFDLSGVQPRRRPGVKERYYRRN